MARLYTNPSLEKTFLDSYIKNIRLELNQAPVPKANEASEIVIEADAHHLGDDTMKEWSRPETEGTTFNTFFNLPEQPSMDAILLVQTFHADCVSTMRINDSIVGTVPGYGRGEQTWTPDVQIHVPSNYLIKGTNGFRIDTGPCQLGRQGIGEFMFRNVRILVNK